MTFNLIAAMDEGGVLGDDAGKIPWRLPRDLANFKRLTRGKPVIMGRKTRDSLGRPLKYRYNIVLTRHGPSRDDGFHYVWRPESALEMAAYGGKHDEAFVIGGAEIYALLAPYCTRAHLTFVAGRHDGPAKFPALAFDPWAWKVVHREDWPAADAGVPAAVYTVLERA